MLWGRVVGRARTGPAHMGGASRGGSRRRALCAGARRFRAGRACGLRLVPVLSRVEVGSLVSAGGWRPREEVQGGGRGTATWAASLTRETP